VTRIFSRPDPDDVVFAERTFDADVQSVQQMARCYPLPEQLQRAVLKRQAGFLAGRVCARQALTVLTGDQPGLIPMQPDRAPEWPPGIVGSITHTTGYAAALVGLERHYQGIGIDCEILMSPDHLNLQKHICVAHELAGLQRTHRQTPPETLLTLVFSAKESLFKCLYRQVGKFFGFSAARVVALDQVQQRFVIELLQDLTPLLSTGMQWTGSFQRQKQFLMTTILYPHPTLSTIQERPLSNQRSALDCQSAFQ
jgi:enterobactin synthetase component D